ncbi:MAG TPA: DEAD/DEAH box helicase [Polyangiaceae bacterium]|jgi:superfamily II DNA or RNA helicase|nr:DEAD/DEAH box helicase [Polyangiaceae bacterium]
MDALAAFGETAGTLSATELRVLAVLALAEPRNALELCGLADACGVKGPSGRKFAMTSMPPVLESLLTRKLITSQGDGFACAPSVRHRVLRLASQEGSLPKFVGVLVPMLFRSWTSRIHERRAFDLLVQLASADPKAEGTLTELLGIETPEFVAETFVVPALALTFEPAWFEALTVGFRTRLLELTLWYAEAVGLPLAGLYGHLAATPRLLTGSADALASFAGIALLQGDLALLKRLAAMNADDVLVRLAIGGSIAMLEGRVENALTLFKTVSKRAVPFRGVAGVIQTLTLIGRGGPTGLELAARLASAGAKKKGPFQQTYGILVSMVSVATSTLPARDAAHVSRRDPPRDCFALLARVLFAVWFDVSEGERRMAFEEGVELRNLIAAFDTKWLFEQYDAALLALSARVENPAFKKRAKSLVRPESPAGAFALHELRIQKEEWETGLEGLERIVVVTGGKSAAEAITEERIVWKVDTRHFELEPIIQKRSDGAWTRGRKLAVKHLLRGASNAPKLPPEDLKVTAYARERREPSYGGYGQTSYFIDRRAWPSLIGHPRVFTAEDDRHVEVTRGTVQVVASTEGDRFVLKLEPPDLHTELELRFDGQRITVFETLEPLRSLVKLLGTRGLSVPVSAQGRALDALGGLAHLLPVHSSAQTSARSIGSDPRPWFRVVPRAQGLSVSLSVRPLGGDGPHVTPGKGARTLVGRSKGEAVQTERDQEEERRLAEHAVKECAPLEGNDSGEGTWFVEEPESCLELISCLKSMGGGVHVEWPEGTPLRLRARVGLAALRGHVRRDGSSFFATGSLAVDGELSLELDQLVALLAEKPGKFIRLESGEYVELEQRLREMLESLSSFHSERRSKQGGIVVPVAALPVLERLTDAESGLTLDQRSLEWRERLLRATDAQVQVPRGLNAELRDYQLTGFRWLARLAALELGACLADDMGLGKTVQLIALLLHRGRTGPALVVAPTSVCENWRRELARFAPTLKVRVFIGPGREEALEKLSQRHVVLTSYALLQQDAEKLQGIEWATVILDEAQLIKNAESQRAKAAFGLRSAVRIAATGTPIENHVGDVFSIFHFLMPDLLGPWSHFNRRFGASSTGESAASGRRALRKLLLPFILRRTKAQVLDDLPPLTEIERTVTLGTEEAALYEAVRRAALAKLGATGTDARSRFQVLAEITRLRRLCCHPKLAVPATTASSSKIASFLELLDELLEARHRALVFSQFVDVLALVRAELEQRAIPYQYLDGSTPPKQRTAAVDAFQAGEGALFLISLRAGGFGLNLTGADYVIHLDPWWNPAVEAQASDRAHRIGQTRPVTVYRLVAAGTVEERIVALHRTKRELADSLLAETDQSATLSVDDLRALLDE